MQKGPARVQANGVEIAYDTLGILPPRSCPSGMASLLPGPSQAPGYSSSKAWATICLQGPGRR